MQATRLNHSAFTRKLEHSAHDPAGNLIEIDWSDVTTLDRSLLPELKRLAHSVPQTGDALRTTLYLEKAAL